MVLSASAPTCPDGEEAFEVLGGEETVTDDVTHGLSACELTGVDGCRMSIETGVRGLRIFGASKTISDEVVSWRIVGTVGSAGSTCCAT